jgi:hypothetical protein
MSLPASLTLSYQQFRVSQTTKQFMLSGSYYKQTPRQLTPIWVEELWDIWDSLSQMNFTTFRPCDRGWTYPLDNTNTPGRAPANTDGTAAQISAAIDSWEEAVHTYRSFTSVQQALKKQIITVLSPLIWMF